MKLKITVLIIFTFFCSEILAQKIQDIEEPTSEQPAQDHPDHPPYQYAPIPLLVTAATTILPLYATSSKLKPSKKASASTSSNDDYKIVQAKYDAAAYIASNGQLNSVYLEQALITLRKNYPNTSDMRLVKAIVAY